MTTRIALQLSAAEAAGLALLIARIDDEDLLTALTAHESEVVPLIESLSALSTQLTLQGHNPSALERHDTPALRAVRHYAAALQTAITGNAAEARAAADNLREWAEKLETPRDVFARVNELLDAGNMAAATELMVQELKKGPQL